MSTNTSKKTARQLAQLFREHGVEDAVVSPGSRNAPLIIALEREPSISTHIVIDERSAAFIGLGMASVSGKPVALVCTSGTAPLNYGPALAEAFYRQIPLIAVTADRPEEWIDQDDSQTIIQPGIFTNYIKGTFDIPVESDEENRMWMIGRKLNDALMLATSKPSGPVHINIRLDEPLGELIENEDITYKVIKNYVAEPSNRSQDIPEGFIRVINGARTMVVCGFLDCNNSLSDDLRILASLPNVVVMHEAQSNLSGDGIFIPNIDATLSKLPSDAEAPEIVITIGGSLTSRMIKTYLRKLPTLEHISIGHRNHSVDCFKKLTVRFEADSLQPMMRSLRDLRPQSGSTKFKDTWLTTSRLAAQEARAYAHGASWSDFQATEYVISHIPKGWNLQLSNGTSVRYAQLFDYSSAGAIQCNRGVSGIDGCTSTAIGASLKHKEPTILLTGDMSMQYDIGALATSFLPPTLKIIVLNNGGGGIFRFINSTKNLAELERCFVADCRLPLKDLCRGYGLKYLSASNMEELSKSFEELISDDSATTILDIKTDGVLSAKILSQFFNH